MHDEKPKRVTKRDRLHAAFRVRAGAIGILSCCSCEYPLSRAPTSTGHAIDCQSHTMTLSAMGIGAHYHLTWTKSGPPPGEPTTKKGTSK